MESNLPTPGGRARAASGASLPPGASARAASGASRQGGLPPASRQGGLRDLWDSLGFFWILWDSLRFFGILWDSLKAPKNSLAFLEILKESLGCVCSVGWVGSNSLGFFWILRDSLGRRSVWILVRRILWDSLGFFGILWDYLNIL